MIRPEPLQNILHYPVTASLALAAMFVTGLWWSGQELEIFFMAGQVWEKWELWRALTSTLPHVNLFHLGFNLYWLWIFGALVERNYGHLRAAGIFALFAFTSATAEFALLEGGVGLSGVGYGLWGFLWLLEKRDPRYHGVIDRETSLMFVVWFFLCIALTITNVMPVANVAHAVGAGVGALLGLAIASTGTLKRSGCAALVGIVVLLIASATVFWPWINLSGFAAAEVEHAGVSALERRQIPSAVRWLETAVKMRGAAARTWYNLGIAYQHQGSYTNALAAYEKAAQMPDATAEFQATARDLRNYLRIKSTNPN